MWRREFRLPPVALQIKNGIQAFGDFDNSDESVSSGSGSTEEVEDDEGTDDGSSNTDRMIWKRTAAVMARVQLDNRAGDGLADSSSGLDEFSEDRSEIRIDSWSLIRLRI